MDIYGANEGGDVERHGSWNAGESGALACTIVAHKQAGRNNRTGDQRSA